MEMCYDGALVMPSSYAVMNEEEMTYVEGGFYLNNNDCKGILFALGATVATSPVTVSALITTVGSGSLTAMLAGVPFIGWVAAAYGVWVIVNSAESFSSALCEAVMTGKGVEVSIGFRWFSPYLKSKVQ